MSHLPPFDFPLPRRLGGPARPLSGHTNRNTQTQVNRIPPWSFAVTVAVLGCLSVRAETLTKSKTLWNWDSLVDCLEFAVHGASLALPPKARSVAKEQHGGNGVAVCNVLATLLYLVLQLVGVDLEGGRRLEDGW